MASRTEAERLFVEVKCQHVHFRELQAESWKQPEER
jgi:hypothetical protein